MVYIPTWPGRVYAYPAAARRKPPSTWGNAPGPGLHNVYYRTPATPGVSPEKAFGSNRYQTNQGRSRTLAIVINPNWLLATMAQSAAALVAIVGGFLVSRVVTLSSERQGLEQRGRELEQRMKGHQERLRETTQRRQSAAWAPFNDANLRRCAERYAEYGSVSPEWLAEKVPMVGTTSEDRLVLARRLIPLVQQANEHFDRGGDMPEFPIGDSDKHKVYAAVNNVRSGKSPSVTGFEVFKVTWARYEKLVEDERELQAGLSALQLEGNFVRTEAARVAKPPELWRAVVAFGYLTVFGVVAPVVGLAWRPVPSSLLWRILLVLGFVSGVGVLGGYLIWAIRQLSKSSKLQGRDEHSQADAS